MAVASCLKCAKCVTVDTTNGFVECTPFESPDHQANAFAARSPHADLGERAARIRLGEILNRDVVTVRGDASIEMVRALILERELDCVPVVGEENVLIGIISQSDLLRVAPETDVETASAPPELGPGFHVEDLATRTAMEVMTPCVHALSEESTLAHALALMTAERLRQIPVVTQEGTVVGLFTALDAVEWMTDQWGYVTFRASRVR